MGISSDLQGTERPHPPGDSGAAEEWQAHCRGIASAFDLSAATVSHHLAMLRQAELVIDQPGGQTHLL